MKVIYIAGPIADKNAWLRELNIRRAEMISLDLLRIGAMVFCPHTQFRFCDGVFPVETFMRGDLEMVKRCDAILMLSGWEESKGSKKEHSKAQELKKPIFYEGEPAWRKSLTDWLGDPGDIY